MKHFLFLTVASISFFSFNCYATAPSVEQTTSEQETTDYTAEIMYLEQVHALQTKLKSLKDTYEKEDNEKLRLDLVNQKYNAMEACNIKLLSDVYENPKEAWQNITQEYDEKELKLTVDILSSAPKKTSTGEDANAELFANWYLGREVLKDVYATPEKNGTLKKGKSFDLWEDQKYIYSEQVNSFLTSINQILGRTGRIAGISAANSFEQNEAAYNAFLKTLPPETVSKLTPAQKSFPKPPKALPPAHEIMWFNDDPAKTKTVFPEWPEPWKQFIQSGFTTYNENGEMAKIFQPKTLVLNEEARHKGVDEQNNRLNVYQAVKKEKTSAENVLNIVQEGKSKIVNKINNQLKEIGIQSSIDANDVASLSKIEEELVSAKSKNIQIVRDRITKNHSDLFNSKSKPNKFNDYLKMSYSEQLKMLDTLPKDSEDYRNLKQIMMSSKAYKSYHYVNALEKDINGEVNFTIINAQEIDHLIKEKNAENALFEEIKKKNKNDIKKEFNKKINKSCLNGGL